MSPVVETGKPVHPPALSVDGNESAAMFDDGCEVETSQQCLTMSMKVEMFDDVYESRDDRRVDTEFRTLQEGLRVVIPAVAVLFSFLLTLPLQGSFSELRGSEQIAFYVAFVSAALATVLLVAPSAHQRMRAPISGIPRQTPATSLPLPGCR
jgi:Family of unknown function (DUF6328)